MKQYFDGKEIGIIDAVDGTLDGTPYNTWCMKEPDYVMRMITTGGALLADDNCNETTWNWMENGAAKSKRSNTPSHLIGILSIAVDG
jgi:hypothetical protein